MKRKLTLIAAVVALAVASVKAEEKLIVVNEGSWQSDNGRLTYFEGEDVVSNKWFRDVNGRKIGDTPCDIVQVSDNLIAIAVNWSNLIQFISPDGKAVAATEDIPNNRRLVSDGRYLYVTSYAHTCGTPSGDMEFQKGYVAKIDVETFAVTTAVEVGYEPEGIALYQGKLFVANSGGYAAQEDHDYERTVSVIDAATMRVERTVDTGAINLFGGMSQSGRYLCINSAGDYYDVDPATVILDCQAVIDGEPDSDCLIVLPVASTYSTTDSEGNFYAIGSVFSYTSGAYELNCLTISPQKVFETGGSEGYEEQLPGTMIQDIEGMTQPYGIYMNPYTGYLYATDAGSFAGAGYLYQWTPSGQLLGKHQVYINPGHFLALKPAGAVHSIEDTPAADLQIYNLQGIPVDEPIKGEIYIRNGRKHIAR